MTRPDRPRRSLSIRRAAQLLPPIASRLAVGESCLRYEAECLKITTAELKYWLYTRRITERARP